jgi:hypothetical protein
VYTIGTATAPEAVLAAATPEHGLEQVAHFTFPIQQTGRDIETYIFKVDPSRVAFDRNVMYISPDALDRMLGVLERDPAAARELAARLEPQVRIVPASPRDQELMDRLRRLAAS